MGRAAAVRAKTKSRTDGQKTKLYNVHSKKVFNAAKTSSGRCNPNPLTNFALRDAMAEARRAGVPADNIGRAIKRAAEGPAAGGGAGGSSSSYLEGVFEVLGTGGCNLLVSVLTDNVNRANADVRSAVSKAGARSPAFKEGGKAAKMGEGGSVKHLYDKKGRITIRDRGADDGDGNCGKGAIVTEDMAWDAAIEAGADGGLDYEYCPLGKAVVIHTDVSAMNAVAACLAKKVFPGSGGGDDDDDDDERARDFCEKALVWITRAPVECSEEDLDFNAALIEALEDIDDVVSVEHNMSNMRYEEEQ